MKMRGFLLRIISDGAKLSEIVWDMREMTC